MKVLLVSPNFYPKVGGIESHLFEVIHNLPDFRYVVLTNWRGESDVHAKVFPGVEFDYVWPADLELKRWLVRSRIAFHGYQAHASLVEVLQTLNRVSRLRRHDIDAIHVHYLNLDQTDRIARRIGVADLIPKWYRWISSQARKRAPIVFTDHTVFTAPEEIVSAETKQALLQSFDNIISVDRASYDVVRAYQSDHGGRVWFIPNSVDTDRFRDRRIDHDDFRVGYAARLGKLGEDLVRKVAQSLGNSVDWHFAVAGERVHVATTKLRAISPRLKLHANLDYTKMPDFYNSVDVLLNPFPGEGVGRTTLEAMACGTPVVGVGTGDKYPIVSGETGYLAPPDHESIANHILRLQSDSNLRHSIGHAAREVVEREFSNKVVLPRLRSVYEQVTGRSAGDHVALPVAVRTPETC